LANTLDPHSRLNGDALSAVTGTVHVVAVDDVMSQLVESAENDKSVYLNVTV